MATSRKNLNIFKKEINADLKGKVFGIVVAEWNSDITEKLYESAYEFLKEKGVWEKNIITLKVPGSYELIYGAVHLAQKKEVSAVICLGCVIKGETRHDEYINNAVANGLSNVGIKYEKPIIFGLLTTDTHQQAVERSGGKHGNKGAEAAYTALRMVDLS